MTVQDEQGVVDAHGQAQHDSEHGGEGDHLDHAGHRQRCGHADPDADDRGHQRQRRGDHGAEHDQQGERSDRQADDLTGPEDLRAAGVQLGRELHRDAIREAAADVVGDRGLRFRGHIVLRGIEDHRCQRGRVVLRHRAGPRRHLQQAGREIQGLCLFVQVGELLGEIRLLRVELGALRIDLLLLGIELRLYCIGKVAGLLCALEFRVQRGLCGVELLGCGVELLLCRRQLIATVADLFLPVRDLLLLIGDLTGGLERVGRGVDARKAAGTLQELADRSLLLAGELAAVLGMEHHAAGATARAREGFRELVRHPSGLGSRDRDAGRQSPACDQECTDCQREDGQPRQQDGPGVAGRETTKTIQQFSQNSLVTSWWMRAGSSPGARCRSRALRAPPKARGPRHSSPR